MAAATGDPLAGGGPPADRVPAPSSPPGDAPPPTDWAGQVRAFLGWLGGVSPHTRRTYRNDLRHFARWYAEAHEGAPPRAERLTPLLAVLYKAALSGRLRLKPATVKRRLSTLRRFSQWALAHDLITDLPTDNVTIPTVPASPPPALSTAAVTRLLAAARQDTHKLAPRNYAMLRLLLETGLRVSELVNLRLADVAGLDEAEALLAVEERIIELPPAAQGALAAYLAARPDAATDQVFLATHGEGLTPEAVRQMINKYARRAGLDPRAVSPLLLRHTYARRQLASGAPLPEVQATLGHARRSSTAIYLQPRPQGPEHDNE